eukprot:IDg9539t1
MHVGLLCPSCMLAGLLRQTCPRDLLPVCHLCTISGILRHTNASSGTTPCNLFKGNRAQTAKRTRTRSAKLPKSSLTDTARVRSPRSLSYSNMKDSLLGDVPVAPGYCIGVPPLLLKPALNMPVVDQSEDAIDSVPAPVADVVAIDGLPATGRVVELCCQRPLCPRKPSNWETP